MQARSVTTRLLVGSVLGVVLFASARGDAEIESASEELPSEQPTVDDSTTSAFEARFTRDVWPLLRRGEGETSCVGCHDPEHTSDLSFQPDARASFAMLLARGYLDGDDPDGLLRRVTTRSKSRRMPPEDAPGDSPGWSEPNVESLRGFVEDLARSSLVIARASDEEFPPDLLHSWEGGAPPRGDNQFISYRQLRGKIRTIFHDDWRRDGRDLFEQHIALFGGADFHKHFSETSRASASFLSGVDLLARDVASRAHALRRGPFADHPEAFPPPSERAPPDEIPPPGEPYREAIVSLYRKILFRDPASSEIRAARRLLARVEEARQEIEATSYDLAVEVLVRDTESELVERREISLRVLGASLPLTHQYVDQSIGDDGVEARVRLDGRFRLSASAERQFIQISNAGTHGNVSAAAVELRQAGDDDGEVRRVGADTSGSEASGAWSLQTSGGLTSYEDGDQYKGESTVTIPLRVESDGDYAIDFIWRRNRQNARAVQISVASAGAGTLRNPPSPEIPPPGEAHFFVDQSDDTVTFHELPAAFRFDKDDSVELSNKDTRRRVTADAVRFAPTEGGKPFLVDNHEASGREDWQKFDAGRFRAYNRVGPDSIHDGNARKGERSLRYHPSRKENDWLPDAFYRLGVSCPAKRDHERRAPIVVRAARSSPIVQVVHPDHAPAGASVVIDASSTYTVQRAPLRFEWRQLSGPRIVFDPLPSEGAPEDSVVNFTVPLPNVEEVAWVTLCRALLSHPDFLFTRPPSLDRASNAQERTRLQLVKITLDLLGRAPRSEELAALEAGRSLDAFIDEFLRGDEFKDFYFHRIRLYLESRGTAEDDEPVRLWCHVAFNDLPFTEILTAEYSVDEAGNPVSRPAHHGKTGILTTAGFIQGKPGLPHFNYAAQVAEKFLGYVFEVPQEIVEQREGVTAISLTNPETVCYSCHKLLSPLAHQRLRWSDDGTYRERDDAGEPIDDSDRDLVASYPFRGRGMEAFASQASRKERFIRTMIDTHFVFFFGRSMRLEQDERRLYRRLWEAVHHDGFTIRGVIRELLRSSEYRGTTVDHDDPGHDDPGNRNAVGNTTGG